MDGTSDTMRVVICLFVTVGGCGGGKEKNGGSWKEKIMLLFGPKAG